MLNLLPIWAMSTPLFGGENPAFGNPWHHEIITKTAAAKAGWSAAGGDSSPVASLAWHCDYVDSYNYNPLWWAQGGLGRLHVSLLHKAELDKLHFDDLTSTQQIAVAWTRYLGGTMAGLLWAASRDDIAAARNVVGAGLHALQDFYSHSNWVDEPGRRRSPWAAEGRSSVPSVNDPRLAFQLYTGAFNAPDQTTFKPHGKLSLACSLLRQVPAALLDLACNAASPLSNTSLCREWADCKKGRSGRIPIIEGVAIPEGIVYSAPPGIALDAAWMNDIAVAVRKPPDAGHLTENLFQVAKDLAEKATTNWLVELDHIMRHTEYAEFWTRVKTEVAPSRAGTGADLRQFEDPWRVPFGFLSAGAYPPDPRGADEGWYLRAEVTTGQQTTAGTDADIYLGAGKEFRMDHMSRRTPSGGVGENRLVEWNDFEAGSHDTYLVGPVASLPTSLTLRNSAADMRVVLATAWRGLVDWVGNTLNDLGAAILSIWGGGADYVGAGKAAFDWYQLSAILARGSTQIQLSVDGASEGAYTITVTVRVASLGDEFQVTVQPAKLHCVRESTWDRGTAEDEPFFFLIAHSPVTRETPSCTCGPFAGVDKGEDRIPGGVSLTVRVPRYGGLIIATQVWESDNENRRMRADAERAFRDGFNRDDVNQRSDFIDAVGRMIGPDWRVSTLDVTAFRRGSTTQLVSLVRNRTINSWVAANRTYTVPCDPPVLLTASTRPDQTSTAVVDQANRAAWHGAATNISPANRVSQVVVPTMARLVAIEVGLMTGNRGQGGDQVTMSVLDARGRELATVSAAIPEGFDGLWRFDLPWGGTAVQPRQPITVMLQDTGKCVFWWKYVAGDPYPAGGSFFHGSAFGTNDFLFRTLGFGDG